jgi:hypothetical protein
MTSPATDPDQTMLDEARRRPWLRWTAGLIAIVVITAVALAVSRSNSPEPDSSGLLVQQTVQAGEVAVTVTPEAVQSGRAAFAVTLDAHEGSLDADLAAVSTLVIDGVDAGPATWIGPAPGGHHQEGQLEFTAPEDPTELVLSIGGLPGPVTITWPKPSAQ